jgi:hypothetical protein
MDNGLVSDQPIDGSAQDRFGRKAFSFRVAETLARRSDGSSIVVGIYGAWGEGKTSVLRMIDEALATERNVVTFWFNPWRYRDEETLLEQFFRSMAAALGASISTKAEDIGSLLKRYKKLVAPLLVFGGAAAKYFSGIPEPVADSVGVAGDRIDGLADTLADVDAESLRERIDRVLDASRVRLVVLVDDLDRLDQQEIQAVFRLIKLTLSFKNTAYVLAFDEEVVEHALHPQYGKASRQFLEKIIQVPLHLPRVDTFVLRRFAFAGVDDALRIAEVHLPDDEVRRFLTVFDAGFLRRLTTPRMARRYANAITFALPILKDEVNLVDLMLIEAVRLFYPRLYSSMRTDRDLYVWSIADHMQKTDEDFTEKKRRKILQAVAELPETDREGALSVVQALFPLNARLLSARPVAVADSAHDRWDAEKRIAARDYFDRYFGYGVPINDISDVEFEDFVRALPKEDIGAANSRFRAFAEGDRVDRLLEKIRLVSQDLPLPEKQRLPAIISANADLFIGQGEFGFTNRRESAAIRIFWLIGQVPQEHRLAMALRSIEASTPPIFALEIKRWLTVDAEKEEPVLRDDDQLTFRHAVVDRLKKAIGDEPIWAVFGRDTRSVLLEWSEVEGKTATAGYLMRLFKTDPQSILPFLESMLTHANEMFSGKSIRRAFSRDNYETIRTVADAEFIATALKTLGFTPELGDAWEAPKDTPEEQTARRFLALHAQASDPTASA